MKTENKSNWHCFEDGMIRVTWVTKKEADEWVARHQSCFPNIPFYAVQYDSLVGIF